jgi:hypothetical protein
MTAPAPVLDVRALLSPDDFNGVVATVIDNNVGMSGDTASRIVTEALAYLAAAADNPGAYMSPSRTVDEGWHALILHTAVYAKLCESLGRFIHHFPERGDVTRFDPAVNDRTLDLIRATGHSPDIALWTSPTDRRIPVSATCSHVPRPGGCSPIEPIPKPPGVTIAA